MAEATDLVVAEDPDTELFDALDPVNNTKLVQMRKAAMLAYAGQSLTEIAKQLQISPTTAGKWLKSVYCQDLLKKFHNSDREAVKDALRGVLPEMCKEIADDIRSNSDNKYKAIDKIFKLFDFQGKAEKTDGLSAYKNLVGELFTEEEDEEAEDAEFVVKVEKDS